MSLAQAKSLYSSSFTKSDQTGATAIACKPSYRDDIHFEEDEDRRMLGQSSTRSDYIKHETVDVHASLKGIKVSHIQPRILRNPTRTNESYI